MALRMHWSISAHTVQNDSQLAVKAIIDHGMARTVDISSSLCASVNRATPHCGERHHKHTPPIHTCLWKGESLAIKPGLFPICIDLRRDVRIPVCVATSCLMGSLCTRVLVRSAAGSPEISLL